MCTFTRFCFCSDCLVTSGFSGSFYIAQDVVRLLWLQRAL